MLRVNDIIKFKKHPKLGERHDYQVVEIAENMVHYKNIVTGNSFRNNMNELKQYGYYVSVKAPEHPELAKETEAIAPKLKSGCKHTNTIDRVFDTFAFKQCAVCGKDMGNIELKKPDQGEAKHDQG